MQPSHPALIPALAWGLPFAGLLACIALLPVFVPRFWHKRMAWVVTAWCLALLLPQTLTFGIGHAAHDAWHAALTDYLPFVVLLMALFTASGGLLVQGGPWGTPAGNTILLAIGTLLAGLLGTTGVAMVLIHPLLRAAAHRREKRHLVLFFILLCANAGGATSPLGDPPLYIGFLHGVPFFWPLRSLIGPLLVLTLPLLPIFYLLDRHFARHDPPAPPAKPLHLRGGINFGLLAALIASVLLQGVWHPGDIVLLGQPIAGEKLLGIGVALAVVALSWRLTPRAIRQANLFTWAPMKEVAVLFVGLFVTITPVLAMLAAGAHGPFAPALALLTDANGQPIPLAYFWATGLLSAFLDNAPTYLVAFELAGGDPAALTGPLARTLQAISAGAVFFGALTYIGNAPNLMVQSIAAHRGIRMPGFFGYIGLASCALLPGLLLLSVIFFR